MKFLAKIAKRWAKARTNLIYEYCRRKPSCELSHDPAIKGVKVDPSWLKKYIANTAMFYYHCRIQRVELKRLKVILMNFDGQENVYDLNQSPAYRCLRGERELYADYCAFKNNLYKRSPYRTDTHSFEKFERLLAELKNKYDQNEVLIVDNKNRIFDGQHRASFLLHKYGGNFKAKVLKIWQ